MTEQGQRALELDNRLIALLDRGLGIAKRYAEADERPPQLWFDKLDELLTGANEWKQGLLDEVLKGTFDTEEMLELMRNQTRMQPIVDELLSYVSRWVPPDHPLLS